MRRLHWFAHTFSIGLLVVLVAFAGVLPAAADETPGNTAAAHGCQGSGHEELTTAEERTFGNSGECVSFAARGGVLLARPSLAVRYGTPSGGSVTYSIQGSGLLAGSEVRYLQTTQFQIQTPNGPLWVSTFIPPTGVPAGTIDSAGNFAHDGTLVCANVEGPISRQYFATVPGGGVVEATAKAPC